MGGSRPYWLPISLQLVDFFNDAGVEMGDYTLIDYVPTASISLTTSERSDFQTAISNITDFSGSYEATFEGLKFSLEQSPCNNYIMVFTDEIGNDVNDATLKKEIITLRDEKKSCIFFVVFDSGRGTPWEQTFGDVGNVIQIDMGRSSKNLRQIQAKVEEAMKKILDGTKDCSVCQEETCVTTSKSTSSSGPSHKARKTTKAPPTTTKAPTTTTTFAAPVSIGGECWSSANGVAAGGCKPGTKCRPWLPDQGSWDGSSPWYCLATPKLASGDKCDYETKRSLCDTGMTCCNNVCSSTCITTTVAAMTTTTSTTSSTTTTTTTTTSTTTTVACLSAGGQCMDMTTFTKIASCCSGLICAPPLGQCS